MRKFLTSVADVYAYDDNENLLFMAKTLLDSSIEVTLGSSPIRGGRGNQLQYMYYHTGEMNFTLTEAQWNLAFLAKTVGQSSSTGSNIYREENVQVTRSSNTVTGSVVGLPIASGSAATVYGWFESDYRVAQGLAPYRGTFATSAFTVTVDASDTIASSDYICVRYYVLDSDATELIIPANMIPAVVKLVMETQLNSSDVSTNQIGTVQIIAPKVSLSGSFSISMTADGVSTTPLKGIALAAIDAAGTTPCSSVPYYARIVENITLANWYDDVVALAIQGGSIALANDGTTIPVLWAMPSDPSKSAFQAPISGTNFTFAIEEDTSSALVSVSANAGLITADSTNTGTAWVSATITAKTSVTVTMEVIVT